MAWTLVGELAFTVQSDGTTETKSLPVGTDTDDIVVVAIANDNSIFSSGKITTSGYTEIDADAVSGTPGYQVAYKVMGGTADTDITIESRGTTDTAGVLQVWRGVNTSTPIDATFQSDTGAALMPNAPSYTTVTDGALRIIIGLLDDDDASGDAAAPSGYSNFLAGDTGNAGVSGATAMIASKEAATAGAEDPLIFGGSGDDAWVALHFGLRPAAASAGGSLWDSNPIEVGVSVGL